MTIDFLKQQFRYHFGQLWDMIKSDSIRQVGLCSDGTNKLDYTKNWSEYSIEEQDKLIDQAMWGFGWNIIFAKTLEVINKTPKGRTGW
jgi:hypothetical protein